MIRMGVIAGFKAHRTAMSIVSALVFITAMFQLASAHTVEDQARTSYTFGPTVNNLALGAKLEQQVVSAGAPIPIKFAITNFGPSLSIFRIGSIIEYTVTGTGPGGIPIRKDDRGAVSTGSVDIGMGLPNGSTYVNPGDDLGILYDFRTPGRYTFTCETALTLVYEGPVYADLKSNVLTLNVQ
jgi:hypothetical protein